MAASTLAVSPDVAPYPVPVVLVSFTPGSVEGRALMDEVVAQGLADYSIIDLDAEIVVSDGGTNPRVDGWYF